MVRSCERKQKKKQIEQLEQFGFLHILREKQDWFVSLSEASCLQTEKARRTQNQKIFEETRTRLWRIHCCVQFGS